MIFTILFNTYSKPAYADPVTIGVTSYEVYTYITLILTYMGVEFKNAQERQRWIEEEYGTYTGNPDGGFYDIIDYQIRRAKADAKFGTEPPKPEPRQIAIPVPDSLIDNLFNKLKDLVSNETSPDEISFNMINFLVSQQVDEYRIFAVNNPYYTYLAIANKDYDDGYRITVKDGKYSNYKSINNHYYYLYTYQFKPNGNLYYQGMTIIDPLDIVSYFKITSIITDNIVDETKTQITLPTGDFNLNWTSPYTGMQTVTMPLTTTGIESPVEVPVIPGEYVEPVPDEVTNPILNPDGDPLINPETGLPFLDPETGLPIFPSTPLVPSVPVTPVPAPETLTQPKDYTPNLTEISNGIKQLPERIINPIKKLFIPDTVSKIDFSPLNVPITNKFPFCIPWDLRDAVVAFSAPPVPPVFTFSLTFFGDEYPIVWDFAIFDEFAEITRFFVLIGFVVGLILATRGLIKG